MNVQKDFKIVRIKTKLGKHFSIVNLTLHNLHILITTPILSDKRSEK